MTKIVINTCYGGFGLSQVGTFRYAELKGFSLHKKEDKRFSSYYKSPSFEVGSHFSDRDIPRDDLHLLQVIKELKDKANGRCADLVIIEIPDGVEWQVEEYDGMEWVAERHRTWC